MTLESHCPLCGDEWQFIFPEESSITKECDPCQSSFTIDHYQLATFERHFGGDHAAWAFQDDALVSVRFFIRIPDVRDASEFFLLVPGWQGIALDAPELLLRSQALEAVLQQVARKIGSPITI